MLLNRTSLLEIHYDPAKDMMHIIWPEMEAVGTDVVDKNMALIRDAVKSYFIKRFLLDARSTHLVPDPERLRQVMVKFFTALSGTTLRKVARLESADPEREARASIVRDLLASGSFSPADLEFRDFHTEAEAMAWLLEA